MFDLDKAISNWRRQMHAAGIEMPKILDELESHLRDDVEDQLRRGVSEQEAFEGAVQRMGQASLLEPEFAKRQTTKSRLQWILKGALCITLLGLIGSIAFLLVNGGMGSVVKILGAAMLCLCAWAWHQANRQGEAIPDVTDLTIWTPNAQQAYAFARAEAEKFHHDFLGTEHLLLGLIKSERGVGRKALRRLGVNLENVRLKIEELVQIGSDTQATASIPMTPRSRKALFLAVEQARFLHHDYVGTEHILLGLLLEVEGIAGLALKTLGIEPQSTRAAILKELEPNFDPGQDK